MIIQTEEDERRARGFDSTAEDAAKIREGLAGLLTRDRGADYIIPGDDPNVVNVDCFNDLEAEEIAAHLTDAELERVRFRPYFHTGAKPGRAQLGRFAPLPVRTEKSQGGELFRKIAALVEAVRSEKATYAADAVSNVKPIQEKANIAQLVFLWDPVDPTVVTSPELGRRGDWGAEIRPVLGKLQAWDEKVLTLPEGAEVGSDVARGASVTVRRVYITEKDGDRKFTPVSVALADRLKKIYKLADPEVSRKALEAQLGSMGGKRTGFAALQRLEADGTASKLEGARDDWAPEKREVGFQVQGLDEDGL